jgi:NAD(P)-dependent dehydrogenase (short-subunit alcohol dehydrogenase family)
MVPKKTQNGKLEDKVAIVTGAGRGIGESIAVAMAEQGARIAVVEVSDQRCKETADKITEMGGKAIYLKADVSVWTEVEKAVAAVIDRFGCVDILVNNAGIGQVENFLDGDRKRWQRIIAVDLMGVAFFSRAVLDDMIKRKAGKIVNISSNAGIFPCARQVIYSAAKGGVVSFTRSLASEMAPYHINVNAICPGSVETPMYMKAHDILPDDLKPYQRRMQDDIPWGRLASPKEIARLAVFLASDDSDYITGQCISVDGGASHYPNVSIEYPYVS